MRAVPVIRLARPADLDTIAALQTRVIIGVAGWTADSREADCAWPRYVFVEPAAAGSGVGRLLMDEIDASTRAAGRPRLQLWSSLNAVPFYQALGFRPIKTARWPVAEDIEMEHLLMMEASVDTGDS